MTETVETKPAEAPSHDAAMIEFVNPSQFKKDASIDLANLNQDMQQHASMYVDYAVNCARARRQFERYKLVQEITEAQLDKQHRAVLKEENPKATEGQIRASIILDPRYKATCSRVIDAQLIFRVAEAGERAFDSRKDMLLQIARDAGREANGALRVTANQANAERLLEAMARNAALASTAA